MIVRFQVRTRPGCPCSRWKNRAANHPNRARQGGADTAAPSSTVNGVPMRRPSVRLQQTRPFGTGSFPCFLIFNSRTHARTQKREVPSEAKCLLTIQRRAFLCVFASSRESRKGVRAFHFIWKRPAGVARDSGHDASPETEIPNNRGNTTNARMHTTPLAPATPWRRHPRGHGRCAVCQPAF